MYAIFVCRPVDIFRAVVYTAKTCKYTCRTWYAVVIIYMSTWFVLNGASHTTTSEPQDRSWLVEFPENIWMFPAMNGCEFSVSTPTCRFLCFLFPTSASVRSRNSMLVVLLIDTLSTITVRSIFSVICTYIYRTGSVICMASLPACVLSKSGGF